jgi:hypothetical protein
MTQLPRPPLLPDNAQPHIFSPEPEPERNPWGSVFALWLLVLILFCALMLAAWVILFSPDTVGLGLNGDLTVTQAYIQQTLDTFHATADAFELTAVAVDVTTQANARFAITLDSQRAALENREFVLQGAETQSALDFIATVTSDAVANAQQATQSALDFQGTRTVFERQATQVELDYQGTQAALNRDATAVALSFATEAPNANLALSQTPPPTLTGVPFFTDGFQQGVMSGLWRLGSPADWFLNADGVLTANRSGAWLLTQMNDLDGYALETRITPLTGVGVSAEYYILLNVDETGNSGLALRINYDGERLIGAGLYRMSPPDIFRNDGLLNNDLIAIQSVIPDISPASVLNIRVEVRANRAIAVINGNLLIDVTMEPAPASGAVGVQVPAGTQIESVTLSR